MAGAPSKYDPSYCDGILKHCQDGASITSYAAEIGVCRDTISEWANVHPEFSAAVKRAKAAAAAWYDKQARSTAVDGKGNATLCIFGLKNFAPEDFKDVQETKHSGGITVSKIVKEYANPSNPDG